MFEFLNDVANEVGNFFSVDSGVTPQTPMSSPDAIKTGTALSDLGFFGSKGESEFSLPNNVKAFQDANGLKVDGVINPGGPTENAISKALQQKSISTSNPLEASQSELPSHVTVSKPVGSNTDQESWTASATFGPQPTKAPPSLKSKIDPLTGLPDPLASAPKGKMPSEKQWKEVANMQRQKAQRAIIPQGDTVQARLQSMMSHPDYAIKKDPALVKHIQGEFERAYPGQVQYDETGKMIQPKPVINPGEVKAFHPDAEQQVHTYTVSDDSEKNSPASSYKDERPTINDADKRIENILNDENARFDIKDNPNASDKAPWYESVDAGKTSVASYCKIIEEEARRQGVDPDLVKAIVFAENARGHYFGAAHAAEGFGLSKTILPMNIDPKIWGKLGIDEKTAFDPQTNVKAGVSLIKRIATRLDNPTPSKIASIWNYTGRENTNDFGAYVDRIYREKKWE
ncbi:MAG: hypothetical protein ACNI26_13590 [Terasakiella sp.]|uniref:hypothetical protein n=1 Tax=unclassified Terasakiella TaxID=2614952 RepID=UPI003AFFC342